MKKHSIGTIVNFCTNESRFIKSCLEQVLVFSSQVIVPVASHFFDGTLENQNLLDRIYAAFPQCLFVEYPFIPDQISRAIFRTVRPEAFWHCLSRLIGVSLLHERIESVLFLDADEIFDGVRTLQWLECGGYEHDVATKLANYWYFREPIYRGDVLEDSAVLVRKKALKSEFLLNNEERNAIYDSLPGPKRRMVMGMDGRPLMHHFSWVRTEEEMLKKVQSWGHRQDRNWAELVRREFASPFQGVDFVHGYRFTTVEPPFELSSSCFEFPCLKQERQENVHRLSERDVRQFAKKGKKSFFYPSLFQRFF